MTKIHGLGLQGYVTTMKSEDLPTLRRLLSSTPDDIEQAGLHPTADQIELFAYHLPTYTLSNLLVRYICALHFVFSRGSTFLLKLGNCLPCAYIYTVYSCMSSITLWTQTGQIGRGKPFKNKGNNSCPVFIKLNTISLV